MSGTVLEKVILGMLLAGVVCVLFIAFASEPRGPDYMIAGPVVLPVCGFKLQYGIPCPTCYMTRAFALMAQGRVATAFSLQPMGALLFLGMAAAVPGLVYALFFRRSIWTWFERVPWRRVFLLLFLRTIAAWGYPLSRELR